MTQRQISKGFISVQLLLPEYPFVAPANLPATDATFEALITFGHARVWHGDTLYQLAHSTPASGGITYAWPLGNVNDGSIDLSSSLVRMQGKSE